MKRAVYIKVLPYDDDAFSEQCTLHFGCAA